MLLIQENPFVYFYQCYLWTLCHAIVWFFHHWRLSLLIFILLSFFMLSTSSISLSSAIIRFDFRFVLLVQLITEWLMSLSFSLFDACFFRLDLSFFGLECYGFQKAFFILRYFLPYISSHNWYMHHRNPLLSRLTWQTTVQPRR